MSRTIKDARQIGLRKLLEQLGNRTHHEGTADSKPAGISELDNLLDSIDLELTQPLRLDASNPADLTINVGPAIVTNTENDRNRTIPHVGSLLPNDFASGTIVFPSTSGNSVVVTPGNDNILTVSNNEYIKVLIYLDANGDLNVLPGTPNAVEADANVLPPPTNSLPIGYVTLFNNAGTIDNLSQSSIFQFGTGAGGGGGQGDANSFIEMLRNRRDDSIFRAFTYYVASIDEDDDDIVDPSSTGEYDLVNSRYKLDTGEILLSTDMLDDLYKNNNTDLDKAELIVEFDEDAIDNAATFELSKDGGSNWETVETEQVGESGVFRGVVEFDPFAAGTPSTLQEITDPADTVDLGFGNGSANTLVGTKLSLSNVTTITEYSVEVAIVNGTPAGTLTPKLVKDNGSGLPSTNPVDVVHTAAAIDASTISVGTLATGISVSNVPVGEYHVVFEPDATYYATIAPFGTSNYISFARNASQYDSNTAYVSYFNGTNWQSAGLNTLIFTLEGFEPTQLDLRARITSSQDDILVKGFATLFDQDIGDVSFNRDQAYINALLLEFNRFGHSNPLYDNSVAGEGFTLRATNGKLVEVSIVWNGFNYVLDFAEVPE